MKNLQDIWFSIVSQKRVVFSLYVILALAATIQSLSASKTYLGSDIEYNRYNNYTIFQKSHEHLVNGQDLYLLYPNEHWDLYKYTPSFSVIFGFFNSFPDWLGLSLWNLLNALVLFFAIFKLPRLDNYQKGLILIFISIDLMGSIQNEQSNGLIAGLLILTFVMLEKRNLFWATFLVVFSIFIKLFGVVGFALFLFYPDKLKAMGYAILWFLVFLLLPLVFLDVGQYLDTCRSYFRMLENDHSSSLGYSVMGIVQSVFSVNVKKNLVLVIGVIIFLIPLVRIRNFAKFHFRLLTLCSILLWVVIFNHKAESPTFIIAVCGIAIWFVSSKKSRLHYLLFVFAIFLTSLSFTDIFPKSVRNEFIKPYALKALPCLLIWLVIIYEMLLGNRYHLKTDDEMGFHDLINKFQTYEE